MSRRHPNSLVVIPFGPGRDVDFLWDTVDSVLHHFKTGTTKIAVINDSSTELGRRIPYRDQLVSIHQPKYQTTSREGKTLHGAIWLNQLNAIETELHNDVYDIVIKMDDDALVCGDDPHLPALKFFRRNPHVGIIGAFTKRGDGSPKREAMEKKGRVIRKIISFRRLLDRLRHTKRLNIAVEEIILGISLRYLDRLAFHHPEYKRGNTCTGGCYFVSQTLLSRLHKRTLAVRGLAYCDNPGEDTCMALLSYGLGLSISDFPLGRDTTIAINWRGLPASPDDLISSNIAIVHPVKNDKRYPERDIRAKVAAALRRPGQHENNMWAPDRALWNSDSY